MKQTIKRGANIVTNHWLNLKSGEHLLIVTNESHRTEAEILKECALTRTKSVDLMIIEEGGKQAGILFDESEKIFEGYEAIIAAADYSLITTRAAKYAIRRGSKFLSLPLSTNDGRSMLSFSFMTMDTKKSKLMANIIIKYIQSSSVIDIKTKKGTELKMYKRNRKAGFFNGTVKDGRGFSSASIEVYVPVEEDQTEGVVLVDGSLGYIGKVEAPFFIRFDNGRITEIEETISGRKLKEYMEDFHDSGMYVASEFGLGLNSIAKCRGKCYIEDESAYGTFHIGLGRNLALGGVHEASGHFDLVIHEPDIYVDNRQIMDAGKIIIPEPQVYEGGIF